MSVYRILGVFILFLFLQNICKSKERIVRSIESNLQIILQYFLKEEQQENNCQIEDDQSKEEEEEECPKHQYRIRMIERSPLIIYIEKFLRQNEIDHLIKLAEPLFKRSMTVNEKGFYSFNEHRTSTSAYLNRHQTFLIKCLEERFSQFQGNIDIECLEPFQIVKYIDNQEYKPHYDWFSDSDRLKNGGQRVTTFFSYLQSNCSSGETEFVEIKFNKTLHQRFCDILICDEKSSEYGIRFRPLPGNTIFWYNMDEYGQVDYLTYHAAHPPGPNCHKIGLNTWTRLDTFHPPLHKEH